ncbi:peptide chain release factor N(5)-glutamine methyltransferase [Vibrio salinus]|uniref:peptide chain release factor N(5)-glutamine methyltransferase n=1 Tax=Vibrio salinus TaxID=2899784 RepID=UPI001E64283C|nr:peptide chain release factor N(5)-glutamine methyltransferase [Vibrio salinus]MCE0494460.1 peptide chain release factor N(5)-glutamine methyltransferase [Vibrio salinus]
MTASVKHTIAELLKSATDALTVSGSPSPSVDATALLSHVLQKPRSYFLTWPEKTLTSEQYDAFSKVLERRTHGEPVAYITGEREFWSLNLSVSPSTLIPRPDTERLVEVALEKVNDCDGAVLDLGTGTGAIALALASELPDREVFGVDIREEATVLAQNNAAKLNIRNTTFWQGSWFEPVITGMKFALVISNPPYIDGDDPHLKEGDVRFEPSSALVADEHGLADIRTISGQARDYLEINGWLLFEHGYKQGEQVRAILSLFGYDEIATEQDYSGNDRVTFGRYTG